MLHPHYPRAPPPNQPPPHTPSPPPKRVSVSSHHISGCPGLPPESRVHTSTQGPWPCSECATRAPLDVGPLGSAPPALARTQAAAWSAITTIRLQVATPGYSQALNGGIRRKKTSEFPSARHVWSCAEGVGIACSALPHPDRNGHIHSVNIL